MVEVGNVQCCGISNFLRVNMENFKRCNMESIHIPYGKFNIENSTLKFHVEMSLLKKWC
jgi:hypothetical protein